MNLFFELGSVSKLTLGRIYGKWTEHPYGPRPHWGDAITW